MIDFNIGITRTALIKTGIATEMKFSIMNDEMRRVLMIEVIEGLKQSKLLSEQALGRDLMIDSLIDADVNMFTVDGMKKIMAKVEGAIAPAVDEHMEQIAQDDARESYADMSIEAIRCAHGVRLFC